MLARLHYYSIKKFSGRFSLKMTGVAVFFIFAFCKQSVGQVAGDWNVYGYDVRHTGYNSAESVLSPNNVGSLSKRWSKKIGGIYSQAVLAKSVSVNGSPVDIIYIGDSTNTIYALYAVNGSVIWSFTFNAPPTWTSSCANSGIISTPTFDRSANTIYVADGFNVLHALDMSTGNENSSFTVTVGDNENTQVHGALVQDINSKVIYVPKSARCEEAGIYVGSVTGYLPSGVATGAFSAGNPTDGYTGGGIWGVGGVAIDEGNSGNVYTATGNMFTPSGGNESDWYGEHVLQLQPKLLGVTSGFAPFNFPAGESYDRDIGSSPVLISSTDICNYLLTVKQKTGTLEVFNNHTLNSGPLQLIQVGQDTGAGRFIGSTAFSPITRTIFVTSIDDSSSTVPAITTPPITLLSIKAGISAFSLNSSCELQLPPKWNTPNVTTSSNKLAIDGGYSSPTVANGVVYYADGADGRVFALQETNGQVLWTSPSLSGGSTIAPTVADGFVFVGGKSGTLYAFGL